MPLFTLFIPTYNRGYCINDALESCEASSFKDFEIVLIDDGSSDNTKEVVKQTAKNLSIPLHYFYQKNSGKHIAFNNAVKQAEGTLFLTLDSDDKLLPKGLQELSEHWDNIKSLPNSEEFASIEFRCLENNNPSSAYPEPFLDSTYLERRLICKSQGEKRSAYRLNTLKKHPYPYFEGERYCRPGLIDIRIAKNYKTRFINSIVIDAGHFPDGIGANRRKIIANSPNAYRQYFLEEITENYHYNKKKEMESYYKRYTRSSLNAGIPISKLLEEIPNKWQIISCIPEAWLGSLKDRKFRK